VPAGKAFASMHRNPADEFPLVHREPPRGGNGKCSGVPAIPKKGVATSCALSQFQKDILVRIFISGKGPLQPELEMLAGGLGIARDVHFVGFSRNRAARALCNCASVFASSEISPNQDQEVCRTQCSKRWQQVCQ